jgi:hypothetical protein
MSSNNTSTNQAARLVLICDSIASNTCGQDNNINQSEVSYTLAKLVQEYTKKSLFVDLTSFASHAKRKKITVDDVKLVGRKNPSLTSILKSFNEEPKKVGRKKNTSKNTSNSSSNTSSNQLTTTTTRESTSTLFPSSSGIENNQRNHTHTEFTDDEEEEETGNDDDHDDNDDDEDLYAD